MQKKLFFLAAAVLFASTIEARQVRFEKAVDPAKLQGELKDAGFQVQKIRCVETQCTIVLDRAESKDPLPLVAAHEYRDPTALSKDDGAEVRRLAKKLDAGTITPVEREELLKRMAWLLVGRQ